MTRDDIKALGYLYPKALPLHGWCAINESFLYTSAIVTGITPMGYVGRYCYEHRHDAIDAFMEWNGHGDPPGPWIKYKGPPHERLGPGATDNSDEGNDTP